MWKSKDNCGFPTILFSLVKLPASSLCLFVFDLGGRVVRFENVTTINQFRFNSQAMGGED